MTHLDYTHCPYFFNKVCPLFSQWSLNVDYYAWANSFQNEKFFLGKICPVMSMTNKICFKNFAIYIIYLPLNP